MGLLRLKLTVEGASAFDVMKSVGDFERAFNATGNLNYTLDFGDRVVEVKPGKLFSPDLMSDFIGPPSPVSNGGVFIACITQYSTINHAPIPGTPNLAGFFMAYRHPVERCYDQCRSCSSPPMSEEQLKSFIAKAKDDKSIHEVKAAKTEDIVLIAKENGHEFTANRVR